MHVCERVPSSPSVGVCVHSMAVRAWRLQLGAYAVHVGRTECPRQQPRPRRGRGETRGSTVVTGNGNAWKGPCPGWWGSSSTLLLPALISGPVHGAGGPEGTSFLSVGETPALQGCPVACGWWVGGNHQEVACWLHSGPMQRP